MTPLLVPWSLVVLLTSGAALPLGWWLGSRRRSEREAALAEQVASLQKQRGALTDQYRAIVHNFAQAATNVIRQQHRRQP